MRVVPPRKWPTAPYKGLDYFSAADKLLFGQRETETEEMVAMLCSFDTRVVLLHGGTGTGKSSFLRAGLCPRLQQMSPQEGRQYFFLREKSDSDTAVDPLLIRATNDPVARIYEALRDASATQSNDFTPEVRAAVLAAMATELPRNRQAAVPTILTVFKLLTAPPQRKTFVLLIDQAEEVLTLPSAGDATNVRSAFFSLIEQTCLRSQSMDLRLVIALRTEYYGRFCANFRINPTSTLTPPSEVGAGLFDYLLRPLGESAIVAAIRWPTSTDRIEEALGSARSFYKFSFQKTLPEEIASDLISQSGETSTLPAMQIVCKQLYERVICKDKRQLITEGDYRELGRAQGAIEAYLVSTLRSVAISEKLPPLGDTDIDAWALVLSRVVGRAEGGTVQTLIASESELIAKAEELGICRAIAQRLLRRMTASEQRLLRMSGGESGGPTYSLGHDSLGSAVLRRGAEGAVRLEQSAKQRRAKRNAIVASTAAFFLLILTVGSLFVAHLLPIQQRVSLLADYANKDQTADFRLKLLLAAAAVRLSENSFGSAFIASDAPRKALTDILLRAPVFGGVFDAAAWDTDGRRVIRLQNNKIVIRDLTNGMESETMLPANGANSPTSIGLTRLANGAPTVAAFRIPTATPIVGSEGGALAPSAFDVPSELDPKSRPVFFSRADISKDYFRLIVMNYVASAINKMWVLPLFGEVGKQFATPSLDDGIRELDWKPIERNAFRQPVLSQDCNMYSFLARNEDRRDQKGDPAPADVYKLWLGRFEDKEAHFISVKGYLQVGSVAITRGVGQECQSIVFRDDDANLHLVSFDKSIKQHSLLSASLQFLAEEKKGILAPTFTQTQPMLAAAPIKEGRSWRIAWPTASGLTLVDLEKTNGPPKVSSPIEAQMLTGLQPNYVSGALSLSPDGSFAFLTTLQNTNARAEIRAFDLRLDQRVKEIKSIATDAALITEACRVAKFQTGYNFLTGAELELWLGSRDTPQPCTGKE